MKHIDRKYRFSSAVFLCLLVLTTNIIPYRASAADLANRTIRLGSSFASESTNQQYSFSTITASNIGSIQFEYCTNTPLFGLPCVAPAGLNATSVGIASQSGVIGFNVSGLTNNSTVILNRAITFVGPTTINLNLSNIVNPSTADEIVYVRISVFDNIDATGTDFDRGSVVFVVEDRFNIDAYVPPYLTFCVGITVAVDCSSTAGFLADFGEFSSFSPTTVTSQMAAATNDGSGYNIFISGQTMTSGNNTIIPLATASSSSSGTSQFGINLVSNNSPSVGSSVGGSGTGTIATGYNSTNQFRFVPGDRVAGSILSTNFNRYTVSYLVNVPENQAPGIYASSFSYTAIASF